MEEKLAVFSFNYEEQRGEVENCFFFPFFVSMRVRADH